MRPAVSEVVETRAHFDVLDGLRGVAAFIVLFGHATAIVFSAPETLVPRKGLAVVFFFMLSGFVVASAYDAKLKWGMTSAEFMLRRAIRLYPLMILGAVLGALWFFMTEREFGPRGAIAAAFQVLCLPAPTVPFSFGRFPLNPPQWSLFLEIAAYGSFAVLRPSDRMVRFITLAFFVPFVLVNMSYFQSTTPLYFLLFEAGFAFYCGVWLWRFYERAKLTPVYVPSWLLALMIAGPCFWPLSSGVVIDLIAAGVVFPSVIILGAVRGRRTASKAEKLVGELSFPIYILHWPIVLAGDRLAKPLIGGWAAVGTSVVATLCVSYVILRYFDEPARRWLTGQLIQRPIAIRPQVGVVG